MGIGRRTFLKTLGKTVAGMAILPSLPQRAEPGTKPIVKGVGCNWDETVIYDPSTPSAAHENPHLGTEVLGKIKAAAKKHPQIRPVTIEGKEYYLMWLPGRITG